MSAFTSNGLSAMSPDSTILDSDKKVASTSNVFNLPKVEILETFADGTAIACLDTKYGIVNENGNWLVEPAFEWDGVQKNGFWITIGNSNQNQVSLLSK